MTAGASAGLALRAIAFRRQLRMHRIGHAVHYLAIIGVVLVACLVIGLVVLAVVHRKGKPGPDL